MRRLCALLVVLPLMASASVISLSGRGTVFRDVDGAVWDLLLQGDDVLLVTGGTSSGSGCPFGGGGICRGDTGGGMASIDGVVSSYFSYSLAGPEGSWWSGYLTLYAPPDPRSAPVDTTRILASAEIRAFHKGTEIISNNGRLPIIQNFTFTDTVTLVPEPASLWIVGGGAALFMLRARLCGGKRVFDRARDSQALSSVNG